jgi:hypothetical protein
MLKGDAAPDAVGIGFDIQQNFTYTLIIATRP